MRSTIYRILMLPALFIGLSIGALWSVAPVTAQGSTYYVSTTGVDAPGNGSSANPWRTITYALDHVPDGSTILVKPGDYAGRVSLRGNFALGVTVRSEVPYQARLRNTSMESDADSLLNKIRGTS